MGADTEGMGDPDESADEGEWIVQRDAKFLEIAVEAHQYAAQQAKEFWETYRGARDEILRAHLIRWWANAYVDQKGHDFIRFVQEDMLSSGFSVIVEGAHYKAWKATGGEMPKPKTKKRMAFCTQIIQPFLLLPDGETPPNIDDNLALLWGLDVKKNMGPVEVVKPRGYTVDGPVYYWRKRLPDIPGTYGTGEATPDNPADDDLDGIELIVPEDMPGAQSDTSDGYRND